MIAEDLLSDLRAHAAQFRSDTDSPWVRRARQLLTQAADALDAERAIVARVVGELQTAGKAGLGDYYADADAQAMLEWASELDAAFNARPAAPPEGSR